MSQELIMTAPPPGEPRPLTSSGRPGKTECAKCHSDKVIVASEKDARGVSNNERGPPTVNLKYRRFVFRCLRCNHKWAEYFA